jgi:hypothetical protein
MATNGSHKTKFSKKDLLFRFPALGLFIAGVTIYITDALTHNPGSPIDLSGFGVSYTGSLAAFLFVMGVTVFLIPIALDVYSVWKNGKTNAG